MANNNDELRTFTILVNDLENGQLAVDATDKLRALTLVCMKQAELVGKAKGEFTLKIKIAVDQGGTVVLESDIKTKEPQPVRARSMTWLTKDGVFTKGDPRQTSLALREVPKPANTRDLDVELVAPRSV